MIDAKSYSISVQFGNFDGETCYEARVKEFPEIAEYSDSFEEAYLLAVDSIEIISEHNRERHIPVPAPINVPVHFSGRITLRMPNSFHRELVAAAEDEGVSLNQHLINMLYYAKGKVDSAKDMKRHTEATLKSVLVSQYAGKSQLRAPRLEANAMQSDSVVYLAGFKKQERGYH